MRLERLEIAYSSHFFLDDKALRASLALLFDKVYLPSAYDFWLPVWGESVKHDEIQEEDEEGDIPDKGHWQLQLLQSESDGLLAKQGVFERTLVKAPAKVPRSLIGNETDGDPSEWYIPGWIKWFRKEAPPEFVVLADNMEAKFREADEKHRRSAVVSGPPYMLMAIIAYLASFWEKTLVPRFFDERAVSRHPISVEDTALLIHQGVLEYFVPHVGDLEDDEILELREKTDSSRLEYAAHLLSLVGDFESARSAVPVGELRKLISDRIKTKIVPSFVEYARSLEILAQIKRVRKLDRAVQALKVTGKIFEPRFWLGAAAALLGMGKDLAADQLNEVANEKRFLAYVTELDIWNRDLRDY